MSGAESEFVIWILLGVAVGMLVVRGTRGRWGLAVVLSLGLCGPRSVDAQQTTAAGSIYWFPNATLQSGSYFCSYAAQVSGTAEQTVSNVTAYPGEDGHATGVFYLMHWANSTTATAFQSHTVDFWLDFGGVLHCAVDGTEIYQGAEALSENNPTFQMTTLGSATAFTTMFGDGRNGSSQSTAYVGRIQIDLSHTIAGVGSGPSTRPSLDTTRPTSLPTSMPVTTEPSSMPWIDQASTSIFGTGDHTGADGIVNGVRLQVASALPGGVGSVYSHVAALIATPPSMTATTCTTELKSMFAYLDEKAFSHDLPSVTGLGSGSLAGLNSLWHVFTDDDGVLFHMFDGLAYLRNTWSPSLFTWIRTILTTVVVLGSVWKWCAWIMWAFGSKPLALPVIVVNDPLTVGSEGDDEDDDEEDEYEAATVRG